LEEKQKLENTIVIFMSDNGPISGWQIPQEKMRFNAGLRDQKFTAYDGGIRTQCYWMWENHWQPFTDEINIAAHIDVVPTLASILNIHLPDSLGIDGIDLSQVLENRSLLDTDRIIFEDFELSAVRVPGLFTGGVARKGKWKLSNGSELYDLKTDPGEQNNVAEKFPKILVELKNKYEEYYKNSYHGGHFFPLPIKVGFKECPKVYIKAHHGKAFGNVLMMGYRGTYNTKISAHPTGVDGDWTSNWKNKGDRVEWTVEFVEESLYEIGMTANGSIDQNSCSFDIEINDTLINIELPEIRKKKEWQYIPLMKINASDEAVVSFKLHKISNSDSLNINELVITKITTISEEASRVYRINTTGCK